MPISYFDAVEQCLGELIQQFEQNQYYFYSEWDAKYFFYYLLASKEIFKEGYTTKDNKKTGLIHTEYPSISRLPVDIVVFDPKTLTNHPLKKQRVLCQIEMKLWKIRHYKPEREKNYRDRLRADTQARKYFVYLIRKPAYKDEFREDLLKHKEANESILIENKVAIVTKI